MTIQELELAIRRCEGVLDVRPLPEHREVGVLRGAYWHWHAGATLEDAYAKALSTLQRLARQQAEGDL